MKLMILNHEDLNKIKDINKIAELYNIDNIQDKGVVFRLLGTLIEECREDRNKMLNTRDFKDYIVLNLGFRALTENKITTSKFRKITQELIEEGYVKEFTSERVYKHRTKLHDNIGLTIKGWKLFDRMKGKK